MTSSISIVYGTTLMQDRLRESTERQRRAEARRVIAPRERRRLIIRLPVALVPRH
jgi:hypothetical protein